jgi:hypothetical protein
MAPEQVFHAALDDRNPPDLALVAASMRAVSDHFVVAQ